MAKATDEMETKGCLLSYSNPLILLQWRLSGHVGLPRWALGSSGPVVWLWGQMLRVGICHTRLLSWTLRNAVGCMSLCSKCRRLGLKPVQEDHYSWSTKDRQTWKYVWENLVSIYDSLRIKIHESRMLVMNVRKLRPELSSGMPATLAIPFYQFHLLEEDTCPDI